MPALTRPALVGCWDAVETRLAAADLTDNAVENCLAAICRRRSRTAGNRRVAVRARAAGGEAEKLYLLRDCAAAAEVALAHLDRDEVAEASALDRRVENGRLLVEVAKVALDAETITVGEYIDFPCSCTLNTRTRKFPSSDQRQCIRTSESDPSSIQSPSNHASTFSRSCGHEMVRLFAHA